MDYQVWNFFSPHIANKLFDFIVVINTAKNVLDKKKYLKGKYKLVEFFFLIFKFSPYFLLTFKDNLLRMFLF